MTIERNNERDEGITKQRQTEQVEIKKDGKKERNDGLMKERKKERQRG